MTLALCFEQSHCPQKGANFLECVSPAKSNISGLLLAHGGVSCPEAFTSSYTQKSRN